MMHSIEVATQQYERAHRRKPRGFRLWYFRMPDGMVFSYAGTFATAKQAARDHARRHYHNVRLAIQLCL
jgi:hypothetical protein